MPTPSPQQTTAHRDEAELAVEQFGDSSATPVLLVHGAGNSLAAWPPSFCAELAQNRPVIRYDTRDAGQSTTWPVGEPGYTLPDLVEDARAVLTATGHDQAHVVGVSMGSAIAQLLALDHSAQIASLTIISGTPGGPGHDCADLPEMTPPMAQVFSAEPDEPDWSDRQAVIRYLSEGERPFQGAAFDEDHQRAVAIATLDRARDLAANLTNHFMIDPGPPWRRRLSEITVPTLVLHGGADPLFPAEHAEALAREIPNAQLHMLRHMGHGFPPHLHTGPRSCPCSDATSAATPTNETARRQAFVNYETDVSFSDPLTERDPRSQRSSPAGATTATERLNLDPPMGRRLVSAG